MDVDIFLEKSTVGHDFYVWIVFLNWTLILSKKPYCAECH